MERFDQLQEGVTELPFDNPTRLGAHRPEAGNVIRISRYLVCAEFENLAVVRVEEMAAHNLPRLTFIIPCKTD